MPLSIPASNANKANFADVVKAFVDGLEATIATVSSVANAANTLAGQKYTKPAQGIPVADLVGNVVTSSVSGVKVEPITETAYTALGTKDANTLYIRTGA